MKRTFTIASLCLLLSACASMYKSEPTYNERMLKDQQEKIKAGEDPYADTNTGPTSDPVQASLWAKSVGSPYIIRNQKAQKVGDLLTIIVSEQTSADTKAITDSNRDNLYNINGTLSVGQGTTPQVGGLTAATENKSQFKADGETNRSHTFTATVQAVVENVLPNGTLFVRGHKAVTINNEDQEIEISGFVRPDDIRINNQVVSSVMADAEIRYVGKGVISDRQSTGWGSRLLDALWPF